ncbi:MAG: oligosaccharyl transferase, archaeosortase A system-associated [Methanosarcina sp.]
MGYSTAKKPDKSSKLVIISLGAILLIAFLMRMLSYGPVTANGGIIFTGYDDFYHMRRILYTTFNFPNSLNFDSYLNYPYGFEVGWPPLFDFLGASFAKLLGAGQPDVHTIEFAGALLPVILGVLTIIPLYVVASSLFDRKTGILAAAIFAVLPGHLFISRFGAVDHHVAETLFSTIAFMFFILALKWAREGELSFNSLKNIVSEKTLLKSLAAAAMSGLFFALLIFTWIGAPVFVSFIVLYVFIQTTIDLKAGKKSDYLFICSITSLLATLLVTVPFIAASIRPGLEISGTYLSWFQVIYILGMLAGILVLWAVSMQFSKRELDWKYYPAVLIIVCVAGLISIRVLSAETYAFVIEGMRFFSGSGEYIGTISEAVPLFLNQRGGLDFSAVFSAFGLTLIAAFGGLFLLSLEWKGENSKPERLFFLLWTIFFIFLALSQRRFSYLLVVNVSILTAYLLWVLLESLNFESEIAKLGKSTPKPGKNSSPAVQAVNETKSKSKPKSKLNAKDKNEPSKNETAKFRSAKSGSGSKNSAEPDYFKIVSSIALIGLIFGPCLWIGINYVKTSPSFDPAWQDSLKWLEASSPETSYFLEPSKTPEYGVLSWWDYGNWILYLSKRPVISNNFQTGVEDSANFFISGSEPETKAIMDKLNVKYVITDTLMAKGKFGAIAELAGENLTDYYEIKTVKEQTGLRTVATAKPSYLNTQVYKLQQLDGSNLGSLRLVHESEVDPTIEQNRNNTVKVFEYVQGAKLLGSASPSQAVTAALELSSNTGRKFTYQNTVLANNEGLFEISVPYATGESTGDIKSESAYSLISGKNTTATGIQVTENDVLNGNTIKVS